MGKRKIKASKKVSFRGKFKSLKMNRMIPWESTIERDFVKIFEFEENFTHIEAQPLEIIYSYKGKKYRYFPDYLVKTRDNIDIVFEIKDSGMLVDERNLIKFQVGKMYCYENGLQYKVITEKEIRKGFLIDNLDLLMEVRELEINITLKNEIISILDKIGEITINDLFTHISTSRSDVYTTIFQMIYTKIIYTDLFDKLICEDNILRLTKYTEGGNNV